MPTTTNPTPAEIASLERRIAEGVMGDEPHCACASWFWRKVPDSVTGKALIYTSGGMTPLGGIRWSPWNNPADALEVLERLASGGPYWIMRLNSKDFEVGLGFPSDERGLWADAPGPHFGPAVCRLAEKVMEGR